MISPLSRFNLQPATGPDLRKGTEVAEEILALKDELVRLDNGPDDQDRKRGSLEILARQVGQRGVLLGEMRFDPARPHQPLLAMNLASSRAPGSGNGTFVADETSVNYNSFIDDGVQFFQKYDHSTKVLQWVYVDVQTGDLGYREEVR